MKINLFDIGNPIENKEAQVIMNERQYQTSLENNKMACQRMN